MFFANPPDHLKDKPIVCRKQANFMICTSSVCAVVAAYGFYRGHYLSSILPVCVFLTSMNFWRHPIYGWRRNVDVACVIFSLFSMLIVAYYGTNWLRYYILITIAASCYPLSHYFTNQNMEHMGTLMHAYMHILGNIAVIILFSGEIRSLFSETSSLKASVEL